jgi:hypothetical protein
MNVGGVLITNNANSHSPEDWAMASARMIFDVNVDAESNTRVRALKLQLAMVEYLTHHHAQVQEDEQKKLNTNAKARYEATTHERVENMRDIIAGLQKLAAGTPWEDHFKDPDTAAQMAEILHSHFATAENIQRQAHAHTKNDEPAKAFLTRIHG